MLAPDWPAPAGGAQRVQGVDLLGHVDPHAAVTNEITTVAEYRPGAVAQHPAAAVGTDIGVGELVDVLMRVQGVQEAGPGVPLLDDIALVHLAPGPADERRRALADDPFVGVGDEGVAELGVHFPEPVRSHLGEVLEPFLAGAQRLVGPLAFRDIDGLGDEIEGCTGLVADQRAGDLPPDDVAGLGPVTAHVGVGAALAVHDVLAEPHADRQRRVVTRRAAHVRVGQFLDRVTEKIGQRLVHLEALSLGRDQGHADGRVLEGMAEAHLQVVAVGGFTFGNPPFQGFQLFHELGLGPAKTAFPRRRLTRRQGIPPGKVDSNPPNLDPKRSFFQGFPGNVR